MISSPRQTRRSSSIALLKISSGRCSRTSWQVTTSKESSGKSIAATLPSTLVIPSVISMYFWCQNLSNAVTERSYPDRARQLTNWPAPGPMSRLSPPLSSR